MGSRTRIGRYRAPSQSTDVMTDWELDYLPNIWEHPETGIRILGEDMPDELLPPVRGARL